MATKPAPRNVNTLAPAPVVTPQVSSGINMGTTLALMQALSGAPAGPVTTTPPLTPATAYQSPEQLAIATQKPGVFPYSVDTSPTAPVSGGAGPLTVMPGTVPGTEFAGNMPAPTGTPAKPSTILGMQPEQFAAMAGMLGSALAPNEYGPTGQLVPSALGNMGNLAGMWGISQMLRKQGGGNIAPGGK